MWPNPLDRDDDERDEPDDRVQIAIGATVPQAIAAGVLFSVLVYLVLILGGIR